jgi:aminoglycoside phosphotransferase family enzyme
MAGRVMQKSEQQSKIIRFMQAPDFYPHSVRSVKLRETHISLAFLTGDFVYKIKKPVDLEFLDFTTLKRRRHFCNREVELNRRLTRDDLPIPG